LLIETLIICGLTTIAPYYDCSENWTIYIHDTDAYTQCMEFKTKSCTKWPPPKIYISLNQPNWTDACGWNTLWHELNHLKTKNVNYCHWIIPKQSWVPSIELIIIGSLLVKKYNKDKKNGKK